MAGYHQLLSAADGKITVGYDFDDAGLVLAVHCRNESGQPFPVTIHRTSPNAEGVYVRDGYSQTYSIPLTQPGGDPIVFALDRGPAKRFVVVVNPQKANKFLGVELEAAV